MKGSPQFISLEQMTKTSVTVIRAAAEVAQAHRCYIYLVGGFVRDFLLGRESWDLDFAVTADPIIFGEEVAKRLGARFVPLHFEPSTGRIVRWDDEVPEATADFTEFKGNLREDASLRDFTCNALFVDAVELARKGTAPVLDPLNGFAHLESRLLVLSSRRVLRDDPLRILRAFRFSATLDFKIPPETKEAIAASAPLLLNAAPERVLMEWAWILQTPSAHEQLVCMDELGVLTILLPELVKLKEIPAAGYHHLDGFNHTLEAVKMVEKAIAGETEDEGLNEMLKRVQWAFQTRFGHKRYGIWVVKFATLLHDIAKPQTMTVDEEGDLHFYGHEKIGGSMAERICDRFKLSRREKETVVTLVRSHMRPVGLAGARQLTDKALRRFWRDLGELTGIYCVALSAADLMATRGLEMTQEQRERHYTVLRKLLETYFTIKEAKERIRLITGDEIIERYKIRPSPLVGKALRLIEEAVLDGRVTTKDDAWSLLDAAIREWLGNDSGKHEAERKVQN
ncbi:MAG: HD domain-containing protein [Armatimonadetes bacterium]|nr:HD domain-containing protein [Armatimonadota bacterium]MCX7967875.1 HD domain-containing protein [Armatimonadota bacterium]MDW8142303.1 HD domain-containing protein [Armatimonadota bacterium]